MDADGNGEISKEEGRVMKEKMRAKMKDRLEKREQRRSEK